jgi:hypothetical protein
MNKQDRNYQEVMSPDTTTQAYVIEEEEEHDVS